MEKEKLIKGLIYIAIIITLCTVASRIFFKSGETLQEYAQNNPELAYAVNEVEENDTADDITSDANDDINDSEGDTVGNSDESVNADSEQPDAGSKTIVEEVISPDRVTYTDGFYYEPLSEELRLYITGTSFPAAKFDNALNEAVITYDDLCYVHVMHYNFDGEVTDGELICNKAIANDLVEIFYELYKAEYQIEKIRLIDEYGGDDNLSMEDNNTFCFNCHVAEGSTKLSKHAYGLAIDINPFYNPYVSYNKDGSLHIAPASSEPYADRHASFPYKIDENDLCLKLFKEHGFTWGGDWNSMKDYQHFQKVIE